MGGPARKLGIELVELHCRSSKSVQRIQLGSNLLRPPFTSKQVHCDRHRQGMVVQDRIQPTAPILVGGVVACSGKRLSEAEEAAHQRPAAWGKETEAFPSPCTANDLLGLILQDYRLGGNPAHGRTRVTWPTGVLGWVPSRHFKLLGCRRRCRLAASKAAHVPTLLRQPDGLGRQALGIPRAVSSFMCELACADYGWGATITSSAVVDKITMAMLSSAPIATASAEMPPLLVGASGG
jgi:hypothetical protein